MYGYRQTIFGLRMCQFIYTKEATILFDKKFRWLVEDIMVGEGLLFASLQ